MEEFYRVRRLPPYVFEQVNRAKALARNAGADIIDLGMGNPDLPAPAHVIDKLKEALGKPRTDRYSSSRGIPGLRRAQAAYYARRFGVKLNPDTQIVATLGSKEGFANVAQAITAPGDVVVVPNPSYPIHAFGFLMAGGVIRSVPSEPNPGFFEQLERAVNHSIAQADRRRRLLSVQSDGLCGGSRLLSRPRRLREEARALHPVRSRLFGGVFRGQPAAVGAAGAGRHRRHRRVHLAVEDVLHAGLAHGFRGRQRAHHRCACAGQILSRLRRVHADPGGGDRGAQRPRGLHPRDARMLQAPARCPGRGLWPRGLARFRRRPPRCSPGRPFRSRSARSAASSSPRCWWKRPKSRSSPGIGFGEHGEGFIRIALVENEQRIRQAARNVRRFLESGVEKLHNVVPLATRR